VAKKLTCSLDNVKVKFYRMFNAIYSRSKGAQSEMVTLQLFKMCCLPFMLYVTEVMPLSERKRSLDHCVRLSVRQVVGKISAAQDNNCIEEIGRFCDLPECRLISALTESVCICLCMSDSSDVWVFYVCLHYLCCPLLQIAAKPLQIATWTLLTAYRNLPTPYPMVPSPTLYDVPFSHNTKRYRQTTHHTISVIVSTVG